MNILKLLLISINIILLNMNDLKSIYEIKINDIWGDAIELNDFKGKSKTFIK